MNDLKKEADKIVNGLFSLVKKSEKTSAQDDSSTHQSSSSINARGNQVNGASTGNNFVQQASSGLDALANLWDSFGGGD